MDREKYKEIILPVTWIPTIPNCSFSDLHPFQTQYSPSLLSCHNFTISFNSFRLV